MNREFGCAALVPVSFAICGVQRFPCQSVHSWGGSSVMPSHHTPPSGVSATLVKIVLRDSVAIAFGFVFHDVPGATPKKPVSGLIALKQSLASGLSQAISSPTVHTFQPSKPAGGISIAKFVLPHADGNAAVTYVFYRADFNTEDEHVLGEPAFVACDVGGDSNAKHFLPSSALPP